MVRHVLGGSVARARRAKVQISRVAIPAAAGLALLIGGGLVIDRLTSSSTTTAGGTNASAPTTPSSHATTPAATRTPDPTPTASSASTIRSSKALTACQAKVHAVDRVLDQARTGVSHWSEHVQAQSDANASKITIAKMDAVFKRTRLAGPADQKRYAAALAASTSINGSCAPVAGSSARTALALQKCSQRQHDQQLLLPTAAAAMQDWKNHLAAMQSSQAGHVKDPQGVWIMAWHDAPPHIEKYQHDAAAYRAAASC